MSLSRGMWGDGGAREHVGPVTGLIVNYYCRVLVPGCRATGPGVRDLAGRYRIDDPHDLGKNWIRSRGSRAYIIALRLGLDKRRPPGVHLRYRASFDGGDSVGAGRWKDEWAMVGNPGDPSIRMRGIAIRLEGSGAGDYFIEYQVYMSHIGNGPVCGNTARSKHAMGGWTPVQGCREDGRQIEALRLAVWKRV